MSLRTFLAALACSLLLSTPAFAQTPDAIDFSAVTILNSPDEVRHWPATSTLTALGLRPSSLHLEHTKQGVWPPVPYGDTTQESTLWIFLRVGDQWLSAGVERIRPNQHDKPEGAPSQEQADWFYDPNRWPGMVQPRPGDVVGYMVAAGDTRGSGNILVRERSNIVLVAFPNDSGRDYPPFEGSVVVPPVPPVPPVVNPPTPPLPSTDLSIVVELLTLQRAQILDLQQALADHMRAEEAHWDNVKAVWKQVLMYALPVLAGLGGGALIKP